MASARLNARQGVRYHLERDVRVLDPLTLVPVPQDGETMGEIMFRGNIAMKGYLKNPKATEEAFSGGWFHSGDLAVMYPDGYIKIKDAARTSSSRAVKTSPPSRWKTCSTATPTCWRRPW